jgi:hypothetical protein
MFYTVLVARKTSKAQQFADALSDLKREPATVYVVGMTDEEALARALADGKIDIDDELTAAEALRYPYVEAIGTEDALFSEAALVEIGQRRIKEIDRAKARR